MRSILHCVPSNVTHLSCYNFVKVWRHIDNTPRRPPLASD